MKKKHSNVFLEYLCVSNLKNIVPLVIKKSAICNLIQNMHLELENEEDTIKSFFSFFFFLNSRTS